VETSPRGAVNAGPAGGARRAEILDAAADLFGSSGYRTSLKDIADACGILPGSLYHHFESKEAIVVELVERYRADLDRIAEQALATLDDPAPEPFPERILSLGSAIAACAVRHRAALLLTLYEPPAGASDVLVQVAMQSPSKIETAMLETLRAGQAIGYIRDGLDLETLADRLCSTLLHISLGVFHDVRGADELPQIRCRTLLEGIAVDPPSDADLDRSAPFDAAARTIDEWQKVDEEEDERLPMLRAVARTEFGRRGYESTTIRHIAAAAGLSTGSVYRLIGSKDELLTSIMRSFNVTVRSAWKRVLEADGTAVEKLDALVWIDLNLVDRFSDEFNIQLAWMRESPPNTTNLGSSFSARMGDLKGLLARGSRDGELRLDGPSADIRAWSLFELLWMPEGILRKVGPGPSLALARDTVLRGASTRSEGRSSRRAERNS
jgi:AcrR family transcriptional regulator